jgi:hypothetical protein
MISKNEIERLSVKKENNIRFPDLFFFEPEILIRLNENEMIIEADDPEKNFYRNPAAKTGHFFFGKQANNSKSHRQGRIHSHSQQIKTAYSSWRLL